MHSSDLRRTQLKELCGHDQFLVRPGGEVGRCYCDDIDVFAR